jgi:hypothetical protein
VDRKITCLWKEPLAAEQYQTAVSMHGHTMYSRESLRFLGYFAEKSGVLQWLLARKDREAVRESKVHIDFDSAYWTPPLTPSAAYDVEHRQIADQLGLKSIISLTDHDNIQAPLLLRVHKDRADVPISTEWSVPYAGSELHLGIHNLPPSQAESLLAAMNAYTKESREESLREILHELDQAKGVLVVLNHPLWDIVGAGEEIHTRAVRSFMAIHGEHVHALELGGLRSWEENGKVYEFAAQWNVAVIGGGDRHGCEPSACLNLTKATSFPEFVEEIRRHKRTHLLFMPQYARPLWARMLQVVLDTTEMQPGHPLGTYWDDRTFHLDRNGVMRPISHLWKKRPTFIETVFAVFRLLENGTVSQAIASDVLRRQQMKFLIGQEEA